MKDGKMELSMVQPDQEDKAGDDKKERESEERIETLKASQHQDTTGEINRKIHWCCW